MEYYQYNNIQEAFDKYLQNSEQAKSFKLEARKVIDIVKQNGGMIVIAHPYQIMKDNNLTEEQTEKVWSTLVELGVSGMECYYSKYNIEKIKKTDNKERSWCKKSPDFSLFVNFL